LTWSRCATASAGLDDELGTKRVLRRHHQRPDWRTYTYDRLPFSEWLDYMCGWLGDATEHYRSFPEFLKCWQLLREEYFAEERDYPEPFAEALLKEHGPEGPPLLTCVECGERYWHLRLPRSSATATSCTQCVLRKRPFPGPRYD
jgi:hypothetical protein